MIISAGSLSLDSLVKELRVKQPDVARQERAVRIADALKDPSLEIRMQFPEAVLPMLNCWKICWYSMFDLRSWRMSPQLSNCLQWIMNPWQIKYVMMSYRSATLQERQSKSTNLATATKSVSFLKCENPWQLPQRNWSIICHWRTGCYRICSALNHLHRSYQNPHIDL